MSSLPSRFLFDQDALFASLDLVRRSGAKSTEFGWRLDDVPIEDSDWWATADYRGAKIIVEHFQGPVEALEGLARRIFAGAMCRRCGKPIALNDDEQGCRWTRVGRKWEAGCGLPIDHSIPTAPR